MFKKIIRVIPNSVSWFRSGSWKIKLLLIIILAVIGVVVAGRVFSDKRSGYVMELVQKHTVTEIVTESGIVTTNGRVSIHSPTTGIVTQVFVANGQVVSEADKLFTVKSTATPQEKSAALATYQAARSAVQQAENTRRSTTTTVDRVHDDLKDKSSTETFTEKEIRTAAEVAHDNAYDSLVAARAQLASAAVAWSATQNSTVTAPVSGFISNLSVVSGGNVTVNSPLAPASPVLIIGGLGETEIVISVGEGDINKIKIDQKVSITADAVDSRTYTGVVRRVDESGSALQGVVTFNVYIQIIDPDDQLKPGMTADVEIVTRELTDVVSVPNTAVKPYQKGRAVRTLNSAGVVDFIPVKIGLRGKEFTQILEGLTEGQEIVVSLTNEKTKRAGPLGF